MATRPIARYDIERLHRGRGMKERFLQQVFPASLPRPFTLPTEEVPPRPLDLLSGGVSVRRMSLFCTALRRGRSVRWIS